MEEVETPTNTYGGRSEENKINNDTVKPKQPGSMGRKMIINPVLNLDGGFDLDSEDEDSNQDDSLFTRFKIVNIKTEKPNVKKEDTAIKTEKRGTIKFHQY